jgi:hypothetical protein
MKDSVPAVVLASQAIGCNVLRMKTKTEIQLDATGEPLISQAKAAELCGLTRAAIHDLVRRGRFQCVETEGRNLVYHKEIEAFAAQK